MEKIKIYAPGKYFVATDNGLRECVIEKVYVDFVSRKVKYETNLDKPFDPNQMSVFHSTEDWNSGKEAGMTEAHMADVPGGRWEFDSETGENIVTGYVIEGARVRKKSTTLVDATYIKGYYYPEEYTLETPIGRFYLSYNDAMDWIDADVTNEDGTVTHVRGKGLRFALNDAQKAAVADLQAAWERLRGLNVLIIWNGSNDCLAALNGEGIEEFFAGYEGDVDKTKYDVEQADQYATSLNLKYDAYVNECDYSVYARMKK